MTDHLESAEFPISRNIVTLQLPLEKKLDVVISVIQDRLFEGSWEQHSDMGRQHSVKESDEILAL